MPTHKSNWKRLRQDKIRRSRNVSRKSELSTHVRKLREAVASGASPETVQAELRSAVSLLDRAAKRGVIHRNAADRRKSRLTRLATRQEPSQS